MAMERHFDKDLQALKDQLVRMGSIVEAALTRALECLRTKDRAAAAAVIEGDQDINSREIQVDDLIIDLLALNQPVASDLRLILAAQKINNDLERIGDHAVNLAESALVPVSKGLEAPFAMIMSMSDTVLRMVRQALDGFIHSDPSLGRAVLNQDDMIDDLNRKVCADVLKTMKSRPEAIDTGVELIRISRNLERVADLATNIAEEVIFIAQAKVVKHGTGPSE
jgi:phosphate transport system protein